MPNANRRWRGVSPLLAACAVWAGLAVDAVAQGSVASDRAALEALYDATDGRNWTDSTNWKASAPLGEWFGVTTDPAGRVTSLEVPGNGLTGPIPRELGSLVNLRSLHLYQNGLTRPIPGELGSLVNLETLDLSSNDLMGPIPAELGGLPNLRWLALFGNDLTGPIPDELSGLANLEWLILSGNWELSGLLPASLRLPRLSKLDIWLTQVCAPAAWRAWLQTIDFNGASCEDDPATIDVAIFYTPGAR